ncbi:YlxR family protein [Brachybacterium saurashtrense]|uniref:YlxR family protein n=1 Tax=Brachybacterium saurashtrense TaxID=556288 RepID=A0A345YKY4_9MICO|nr:YlxR family protein [Brachybacterium saurashtrense]AXK44586.1 YlxR family protein [Brachybacterium saurashtrense]RRR23198.1 YlxR family protein [Brachybacterium saurashtrense]
MDTRSSRSHPERTCVGCRQAAPRAQLVRLVREPAPDGSAPRVRVDPTRSAPGRGAWLHPDASCLDLALRRGGVARSFRGPVDTGLLAQSLEDPDFTRTWNR